MSNSDCEVNFYWEDQAVKVSFKLVHAGQNTSLLLFLKKEKKGKARNPIQN